MDRMMNGDALTAREKATNRRYFLEMGGLLVVYIAVLFLSIRALEAGNFSPAFRTLIAVTPALPMFGIVAAVIRFLLSIDELQRQIHLEAFAISAGITAALAITYTFLEGVGFPHSQAWWAFASLDIFWAASLPFVRRRYA